jgi:putative Ca2+/H+ antiporter (TMEM165/GDT1 family)
LQAYFISLLLVALAEIGDRTQLLTLLLSSRFRRPWPIIAGIFVATVASHLLAAFAGFYLSSLLTAVWFKYAVAFSFIAMALWALVPDKSGGDEKGGLDIGVFFTTVVMFFLAEIGDKTQIATMALAARFHNVWIVAAGTTTGMMLANIPAAFFGGAVTRIVPVRLLRIGAAVIYLALGFWALASAAGWIE